MAKAIVVLTYKSVDELVLKEASDSWRLNPEKANSCKYLICARNQNDQRKIWAGKEKHREAFLICKIKDITKSIHNPSRFQINFSEYANISIKEFWSKDRNPIIYKDFDIENLNGVNFKKVDQFKEGTLFKDRKEIHKNNLHNNLVFGISQNAGIANYIVLSGGYVDETNDRGDEFIYIGQGGRDEKTKKQISDQTFDNTHNKSLVFNCNWNIPVRVFRGSKLNSDYAPVNGYRYDGKYMINDFWYSTGVDGFKICNFKLVKPDRFIQNEKTKNYKKIPLDIFKKPAIRKLREIDLNKLTKKWVPKGNLNLEKNYQNKIEILEKTNKKHEKTISVLGKFLKENNFKNHEGQFDLYTEDSGVGKLFEIKTWNNKNLKEQIRNGIIKLLEYRIRYQKEGLFPKNTDLYLMLDSDPKKIISKYNYLLDLMEELKITLCWLQNNKVRSFKISQSNLYWIDN